VFCDKTAGDEKEIERISGLSGVSPIRPIRFIPQLSTQITLNLCEPESEKSRASLARFEKN